MNKNRKSFVISLFLFLAFFMLTFLVMKVDVQPIGPEQSTVGLATINSFVFEKLGVNSLWYSITDWLGIVAILVALGFAMLGFIQMIKRRSLLKVDLDIILLGAYYLLVIGAYVIFELFIVNYRPIILSEGLEASFPSSHTMIVLCIMGTAMIQFQKRLKGPALRKAAQIISALIILVTIIGRLISGVHWVTDISAGLLLGMAFILLYAAVIGSIENTNNQFSRLDSENDI